MAFKTQLNFGVLILVIILFKNVSCVFKFGSRNAQNLSKEELRQLYGQGLFHNPKSHQLIEHIFSQNNELLHFSPKKNLCGACRHVPPDIIYQTM